MLKFIIVNHSVEALMVPDGDVVTDYVLSCLKGLAVEGGKHGPAILVC